ncbi:carbohydrate ABC transporter permease [Streptomyces sp. NPDC056121]|uniref:carbohydrate ABC transporter permease n=1 Tax=Streptomyces TaxID=1883 RepID=UPI001D0B8FD1|nr:MULTISPECIES: carbohydrate ABC transporter permease [Streptomyces]MCX5085082.1 carbohydrate ABC transporter permease [Streptomyces sp. NBC_00401]UDM03646.1 carbohydrate ABC transporter permease [Streptomyces longhuiensis]
MTTAPKARLRPLAASLAGLLFFLPIYIVLVNVLKNGSSIVSNPVGLPFPPTLDNIDNVLSRPDHLFWYGLVNSTEVTVISILVVTVISAMLGHYLARSTGTLAKVAMVVLLCGLMVPPAVILTPITEVLRAVGLMSTVPGLILAYVGYYMPFGVFVFAGFVKTIPRELEEAAALDGAGAFRTFWQVVFPLMRPASASVLIFLGVWIWNDFLNPLIILGPAAGTTVTVGIYRAIGEHQADFGSVFALMFLATLPILIFYLAFQKQFVKGLTGGATKG